MIVIILILSRGINKQERGWLPGDIIPKVLYRSVCGIMPPQFYSLTPSRKTGCGLYISNGPAILVTLSIPRIDVELCCLANVSGFGCQMKRGWRVEWRDGQASALCSHYGVCPS